MDRLRLLRPSVGVRHCHVNPVDLARAHLDKHPLDHASRRDNGGVFSGKLAAEVLQVVEDALGKKCSVEALEDKHVCLVRHVFMRLQVPAIFLQEGDAIADRIDVGYLFRYVDEGGRLLARHDVIGDVGAGLSRHDRLSAYARAHM
eukprot:scaffold18209_cov33-Tisochrysis_lutea.AAC.1